MDNKDQWYVDRWGKFTASEIYKILSSGRGSDMFGAPAKEYIRQKAIENMSVMWERPELEFVKAILHGRAHEYPAFEAYKSVSRNYSMQYFGSDNPVFIRFNEDSGGSPDGIIGSAKNVTWGLELKCPKNPGIHLDHMEMANQYDLEAYNLSYYAQIQFNLMVTKAEGWHFVSYDERYRAPHMKIKILDVFPDRRFQDNLEIRLRMAIRHRNEIISRHLG